MPTFQELLEISAARHNHLCPRQVLGVRMGLAGGRLLNIALPQVDKRLLTIVETDGCAFDGITIATGCYIGRRTAWLRDFGKIAATFIDSHTERAVRILPKDTARHQAAAYVPDALNRWEAYLLGYQRMPDEQLLTWQEVCLTLSLDRLLSREGYRVKCAICAEEIINEREVVQNGQPLCRSCAGETYYQPIETAMLGLLKPPSNLSKNAIRNGTGISAYDRP